MVVSTQIQQQLIFNTFFMKKIRPVVFKGIMTRFSLIT